MANCKEDALKNVSNYGKNIVIIKIVKTLLAVYFEEDSRDIDIVELSGWISGERKSAKSWCE